jgi:hypothetical protein
VIYQKQNSGQLGTNQVKKFTFLHIRIGLIWYSPEIKLAVHPLYVIIEYTVDQLTAFHQSDGHSGVS